MKLISISRPMIASTAAMIATGSPRLCTGWKKPRPWKLLMLRTRASYHCSGWMEERGRPKVRMPCVAKP